MEAALAQAANAVTRIIQAFQEQLVTIDEPRTRMPDLRGLRGLRRGGRPPLPGPPRPATAGSAPSGKRLSTRADAALVERLGPEAVVIASGGVGAAPPIPGIDSPRVADLRGWLASRASGPHDQTVTVLAADRLRTP